MLPTRAIVSLTRARATVNVVSASRRRLLNASGVSDLSKFTLVRQERSHLIPRRWNSSSSSSFQSNRDQQQQLAPLGRALVTTSKTIKSLLIFSASTVGLGYFLWSGAHVYLEQYKCPTPQNLSSRVQSLLHGAYVREEYAMDPDVAQEYYKNAVDFATEEIAQQLGLRLVGYPSASQQLQQQPKTKWGEKTLQDQLAKQAKDPRMQLLEMDAALVEVHHRRARFFDSIGMDQQAAMIWDRLWRMTDAAEAKTSAAAASQQQVEELKRPLMARASGVLFARRAAECWMRLGQYDEAEEALAWALESVTIPQSSSNVGGRPPAKGISVDTQSDEISLLTILGALYARKRRFDDALSLFVRALQLTQQRKEAAPVVEIDVKDTKASSMTATNEGTRNKWHCREAILMNSIGEALYGSATISTATAVAEKSSDKKQDDSKENSGGGLKSYFWSSSSSSKGSSSEKKLEQDQPQPQTIVLNDKEQEALGWMQKALMLAQEKSGKERDCDECAALILNNLGMIYEMKGDTKLALEQFKNAVVHATTALDYVGLESYMENIARLQEATKSESEALA